MRGSPSASAYRRSSEDRLPDSHEAGQACRDPCPRGPCKTPPPMRRYARHESSRPAPLRASLAELPYLPAAALLGSRRRRLRRVAALVRQPQLRRQGRQPPALLVPHVEHGLQLHRVTPSKRRLDLRTKQPARHHGPAVFLKHRHLIRAEEISRPRIDRFAPNLRLIFRQPLGRLKMHARGRQGDYVVAHYCTPRFGNCYGFTEKRSGRRLTSERLKMIDIPPRNPLILLSYSAIGRLN